MSELYTVLTLEDIKKLAACFSCEGEFDAFQEGLQNIVDDISFSCSLLKRTSDDDETLVLKLKMIFLLSVFFKDNIEVLMQIVNSLSFQKMTLEEIEDHKKNGKHFV